MPTPSTPDSAVLEQPAPDAAPAPSPASLSFKSRATSRKCTKVSDGPGRRNGEIASISATSASAGTARTRSAPVKVGTMPGPAPDVIVIVPPSETSKTWGCPAEAAAIFNYSRCVARTTKRSAGHIDASMRYSVFAPAE